MQETEYVNVAVYDKKTFLYIGLIVLGVFLLVVLFGRLSFHNELEQDLLPHTLIGYIDDVRYFGDVTVSAEDWPEWTMEYDKLDETSVHFEYDVLGGRIGIFANLVYYENRYELRSWFSGKLLERASEYYYKPEGTLYLAPVYEPDRAPEISLDEMVPQGYDFTAFDGR